MWGSQTWCHLKIGGLVYCTWRCLQSSSSSSSQYRYPLWYDWVVVWLAGRWLWDDLTSSQPVQDSWAHIDKYFICKYVNLLIKLLAGIPQICIDLSILGSLESIGRRVSLLPDLLAAFRLFAHLITQQSYPYIHLSGLATMWVLRKVVFGDIFCLYAIVGGIWPMSWVKHYISRVSDP